jgi:hypothetical protein
MIYQNNNNVHGDHLRHVRAACRIPVYTSKDIIKLTFEKII